MIEWLKSPLQQTRGMGTLISKDRTEAAPALSKQGVKTLSQNTTDKPETSRLPEAEEDLDEWMGTSGIGIVSAYSNDINRYRTERMRATKTQIDAKGGSTESSSTDHWKQQISKNARVRVIMKKGPEDSTDRSFNFGFHDTALLGDTEIDVPSLKLITGMKREGVPSPRLMGFRVSSHSTQQGRSPMPPTFQGMFSESEYQKLHTYLQIRQQNAQTVRDRMPAYKKAMEIISSTITVSAFQTGSALKSIVSRILRELDASPVESMRAVSILMMVIETIHNLHLSTYKQLLGQFIDEREFELVRPVIERCPGEFGSSKSNLATSSNEEDFACNIRPENFNVAGRVLKMLANGLNISKIVQIMKRSVVVQPIQDHKSFKKLVAQEKMVFIVRQLVKMVTSSPRSTISLDIFKSVLALAKCSTLRELYQEMLIELVGNRHSSIDLT